MEASIASLSMHMAQANFATQFGVKMLDNMLEADVQAASTMIAAMSSMPAPSAGSIGGLLDVRG